MKSFNCGTVIMKTDFLVLLFGAEYEKNKKVIDTGL